MIIKVKIKKVLLKMQRWTKTDMVYLTKGGFWLTLGQAGIALSGIILAIILGNWLEPENYGQYKYILSVTGLLMLTSLTGMNTAIIQSVSKGFEGSFYNALKKRIQWGVIGGLISICVAAYYWYQGSATLAFAFLIASVFIPFIDSFKIYLALLNGRKYFKQFSIYNLVFFTGLVIVVGSTVFFSRNILLLIIMYFLYNTLTPLFFLLHINKRYILNSKIDVNTISFGKHLSFQGIIINIANYIDKILIFYLLGPVQLAVYSIAIMPIQQIRGPQLRGFGRLILPKLSNRNLNELRFSLSRKIFLLFIIIALLILLYILLAPYLFKYIFPQYIESVVYSQVFALTLLSFPLMLVSNTLIAHSLYRQLYIYRIVSPILKIVFLFVFVPIYGIWGAVVSFLFAELINISVLFYFYKNLHKYSSQ